MRLPSNSFIPFTAPNESSKAVKDMHLTAFFIGKSTFFLSATYRKQH